MVAHALDKRDHPFELRTVRGVWAALFAHCGILANEVTYRFECRGHPGNEGTGEPELAAARVAFTIATSAENSFPRVGG